MSGEKKEPDDRPPGGEDTFGVGMNSDGSLNVVTPEEMARRIALRDAMEAEDDEEDLDDLSDLDDLDAVIEKVRDL